MREVIQGVRVKTTAGAGDVGRSVGRRRVLAGLGGAALLPLLGGCGASRPVAIASHVWPGYELIFLARKMGWLPPERVALLEAETATDSIAALRLGKVDGAALTLDEVLRVRGEGIPLTVILVFDVSVGADVVLARPGIAGLAGLKGKRIGVEDQGRGALMLHRLLEKAGLGPQEVVPVQIKAEGHMASWSASGLDAIITYEPSATEIEKRGARPIFDSRQIPGEIIDVLAVKPEAVRKSRDDLQFLLAAHFRGLQHFFINREDAIYRIAARMKLSPDETLEAFRGLDLPDLAANRSWLSGDRSGLLSTARRLADVMAAAKLLRRPDSLAGIASDACLPAGVEP